jgi:D,D-heptose 1,7-bisphosphate phosphatase
MYDALILAGGKGTRLKDLLAGDPKPLIKFNDDPLLAIQLRNLERDGFKKVAVLVNYEQDKIKNFISTINLTMDIDVISDTERSGTAGAVMDIAHKCKDCFIVLYGDLLLDFNFNKFLASHHSDSKNDCSIVVHPNNHPYDSDLVETNGSFVSQFISKPHLPESINFNLVNAAIYCFKKDLILQMRSIFDENEECDFGKDVFPYLVRNNCMINAYQTSEYIKDIGTPDRYINALSDYRDNKLSKKSLHNKQKAVFIDRDGTVNIHKGYITSADQIQIYDDAVNFIQHINKSDYLIFLITNQPQISMGKMSLDDFFLTQKTLETYLGELHCYFDDSYYCPHHPHKGFEGEILELKIVCDCRKPQPGMVYEAAEKYNIDIQSSFVIGDSDRDYDLAINIGAKPMILSRGEDNRASYIKKYDSLNDILQEILQ